jgi:hypothetical protein
MLAVLQDALRILTGAGGADPFELDRQVAEARNWMLSDDTSWPFAFRNLCVALDIDADRLRRRVTRPL